MNVSHGHVTFCASKQTLKSWFTGNAADFAASTDTVLFRWWWVCDNFKIQSFWHLATQGTHETYTSTTKVLVSRVVMLSFCPRGQWRTETGAWMTWTEVLQILLLAVGRSQWTAMVLWAPRSRYLWEQNWCVSTMKHFTLKPSIVRMSIVSVQWHYSRWPIKLRFQTTNYVWSSQHINHDMSSFLFHVSACSTRNFSFSFIQ